MAKPTVAVAAKKPQFLEDYLRNLREATAQERVKEFQDVYDSLQDQNQVIFLKILQERVLCILSKFTLNLCQI